MKSSTLSKYIFYNLKDIVCQDDNGNVINGTKLDSEEYSKGNSILLHFRDGYLDGDVFDKKGNFKEQLPAVEGKNHQEYWRKNKLHRDGGLPAIISGEPPKFEWWVNGVQVDPPTEK